MFAGCGGLSKGFIDVGFEILLGIDNDEATLRTFKVPTIRENARLQSFPDCFVFFGNKTQQNRQVGNAVPPLLGYHLAKAMRYIIEK